MGNLVEPLFASVSTRWAPRPIRAVKLARRQRCMLISCFGCHSTSPGGLLGSKAALPLAESASLEKTNNTKKYPHRRADRRIRVFVVVSGVACTTTGLARVGSLHLRFGAGRSSGLWFCGSVQVLPCRPPTVRIITTNARGISRDTLGKWFPKRKKEKLRGAPEVCRPCFKPRPRPA